MLGIFYDQHTHTIYIFSGNDPFCSSLIIIPQNVIAKKKQNKDRALTILN